MDQNVFINLIRDKQGLIEYLLQQMQTSAKIYESLPHLRERGWSEQGMLDKLLEVTSIQSKQILLLTQLMLIYTQDSAFTAAVAKMCLKMGNGEDALRAMFDAKMKEGQ